MRRQQVPTIQTPPARGQFLPQLALWVILALALVSGFYWATQGTPQSTSTSVHQGDARASDSHQSMATRPAPTSIDNMDNARWLRSKHKDTYNRLQDLSWIRDGLTDHEPTTAQDLLHLAGNDHQTLQGVLALHWVQDAITTSEAKAILGLVYLSYRAPETTRKLLTMPFLESVAEADALLIDGLHYSSQWNTLTAFMDHATIADGITDDEVIFAIAATLVRNPSHLDRMLTPGNATVETVQTATSRTPRLSISIVRTGVRKPTNSNAVVEDAIIYLEDTMDMALPTNHVILVLDDHAVPGDYSGINYGHGLAYLTRAEDGTDWNRDAFKMGMIHEVAHYFWQGNEQWLDEGVANTLEYAFGRTRGLTDMGTSKRRNCTLDSLEALSILRPNPDSPQYQCNYHLGEKLLLELRTTQGEEEFRTGLRNLHQLTTDLAANDEEAGIDQLRAAFQDQLTIVDRHWAGTPPPAHTARRYSPDIRLREAMKLNAHPEEPTTADHHGPHPRQEINSEP